MTGHLHSSTCEHVCVGCRFVILADGRELCRDCERRPDADELRLRRLAELRWIHLAPDAGAAHTDGARATASALRESGRRPSSPARPPSGWRGYEA